MRNPVGPRMLHPRSRPEQVQHGTTCVIAMPRKRSSVVRPLIVGSAEDRGRTFQHLLRFVRESNLKGQILSEAFP